MSSFNLFRGIDTVAYAAGDTIFKKGEPGDVMYLIKVGRVNIVIEDHRVNTMQSGDIFGEMALINSDPRSATAVAATDCSLLLVDEERFLFLVQQTPYFSLQVMGVLADRLRNQVKPWNSFSRLKPVNCAPALS